MNTYHKTHRGHDLQQTVRNAIARQSHLSGHELQIDAQGTHVTLSGTVASYYQKQVAQESVRGLDGVDSVRNELQVRTPGVASLAGTKPVQDATPLL